MRPPFRSRVRFQIGQKVEVCGKEEGFFGSYYEATIVSCVGNSCYLVQYKNLLSATEPNKPLVEMVKLKDLRPIPSEDLGSHEFIVNQNVDVFDNDGWWVGKITSKRGSRYSVYFSSTNEEIVYPSSQIRVHLDWIDGSWVYQDGNQQ
ncbi:hypothetical protein HN51_011340 [Arachis hypogaea]|uniref:Agenet domain-containing protein n=1 Tax=Arachis hypogaea TaxID=3818 RepID=A0A445DZJ6_ARAHY|nr:DUF724 domain-containing protein 3 [Arachis hypogaea]QHO56606.1 uncharacterized protein DS421_3g75220 [Arachis hypogaea]RYR68633.1 hypothetical protein Ahy_A03g015112 [Arachis hypogaea]